MVRKRIRRAAIVSGVATVVLLAALALAPSVTPQGLSPSAASAHDPAYDHFLCQRATYLYLGQIYWHYHTVIGDNTTLYCAVAYSDTDCYTYYRTKRASSGWSPARGVTRVWCRTH